MTSSAGSEWRIGYLSHIRREERYWGGLLVVDLDGDPIDFAWTESIEVSRFARPLYGEKLASTLVSKTFAESLVRALETEPDVLCMEEPSLLARNVELDVPMAVLAPGNSPNGGRWCRTGLTEVSSGRRVWFAESGEEDLVTNVLGEARKHFAPGGLTENAG